MPEINLSNADGRDALVTFEVPHESSNVRWLDLLGRQAAHVRVLKSTLDHDFEALVEKAGNVRKLTRQLLDEDPEVDMEVVGTVLQEVSRVYVGDDRQIRHQATAWEVVHNTDGSIRERRPKERLPQNIRTDTPLCWSGMFIPRSEAYQKFVFSDQLQLVHINGLTYDFLYGMAKELEVRDSMMLLGAGQKSNQPLVLRRGGSQHRGFLEGRTRGDRYRLVLHLSKLELKAPE